MPVRPEPPPPPPPAREQVVTAFRERWWQFWRPIKVGGGEVYPPGPIPGAPPPRGVVAGREPNTSRPRDAGPWPEPPPGWHYGHGGLTGRLYPDPPPMPPTMDERMELRQLGLRKRPRAWEPPDTEDQCAREAARRGVML